MKIRHIQSGELFEQITEFDDVIRDWNCDGDIYPMYGAYFKSLKDGVVEFVPTYLIEDEEWKEWEVIKN